MESSNSPVLSTPPSKKPWGLEWRSSVWFATVSKLRLCMYYLAVWPSFVPVVGIGETLATLPSVLIVTAHVRRQGSELTSWCTQSLFQSFLSSFKNSDTQMYRRYPHIYFLHLYVPSEIAVAQSLTSHQSLGLVFCWSFPHHYTRSTKPNWT